MAIVDNFTKEQLIELVNNSHSYKELLRLLGYTSGGGNSYKTV